MKNSQIISQYKADNVEIPQELTAEMRSNHAGETGAVWIYVAATLAFWSPKIQEMAKSHGKTELNHLMVMEHLVAKNQRSKLIFLWKIMGFSLGLAPSIFGYRAFCITINAVEKFVEQHYQSQIEFLQKSNSNPQLLAILQKCCDEEVEHKEDALAKINQDKLEIIGQIWSNIVGTGSKLAVLAAKKI